MKLLSQIGIIFGICLASTGMEALLPFSFPASVIGMILTFLLLVFKIIKLEQIHTVSDFLLGNMAFFFVPAGVNIINYLSVLHENAIHLVVICVVSTILTFAATAYSIKFTMHLMKKGGKNHD